MPQMKPIYWSSLYLYFLSLILIKLILNYYNYIILINSSNKMNIKNKSLNWKW